MVPTRELWFTAPGVVELRSGSQPPLRAGHIVARALASGVSQGTEMLLFRGEGSASFDPSLGPADAPTYPRRYGYSWVGEVTEVAQAGPRFSIGDRVFALASHGDVHELSAESARRIDPSIPPTRAVLAANLETAVNCIWDSRVSIGDRVVVLGAGVVGLLIAWLCSKVLAEVTVIEPSKVRRQAARDLGLTSVAEPSDGEFDADVVVEASGSPEVLDRAVMCAGQAARVIVVSNYGARRHALNLGDRFHRRRLTIQSSQVSSIPADRVARWSIQRRFETVERLLHEPMLDRLVDHVVGFSQAPDVYRQLDQRAGDWLQTVFVYRDQPTMAPPTPSRTIECTR